MSSSFAETIKVCAWAAILCSVPQQCVGNSNIAKMPAKKYVAENEAFMHLAWQWHIFGTKRSILSSKKNYLMKKIFLASFVLALIFTAAITTAAFCNVAVVITNETPVKVEELPEAIKQTLASKFEGWTATAAFLVSGENEHYKVEINKGEQKQTVKINKDGSLAEGSNDMNAWQSETPVKVEELPEAVKKTIVSKFEGWMATAAWLVSGESEFYKVELTKEEAKQVVKIAKDGSVIE